MNYSILTQEEIKLKAYKTLGIALSNLKIIKSVDQYKEYLSNGYRELLKLIEELLILTRQEKITSFKIILDFISFAIKTSFSIFDFNRISGQEFLNFSSILEECFKLIGITYTKVYKRVYIYTVILKSHVEDKPIISLPDIRDILYQNYLDERELDYSFLIIRSGEKGFKVHKLILMSLNSPYFNALLASEMKEKKESVLKLEDDPEVINYFIEFIYLGKDKFSIKYPENLPYMELFVLAKRLEIKALSNYVLNQIDMNLDNNSENLTILEEYLDIYKDDIFLRKIVESFKGTTIEDFLRSPKNTIIRKYYNSKNDKLIIQDNRFVIVHSKDTYLGKITLTNDNNDEKHFVGNIDKFYFYIQKVISYPGVIKFYLNGYESTKYDELAKAPNGKLKLIVEPSKQGLVKSRIDKEYISVKYTELSNLMTKFVSIFGLLILEEIRDDITIYYSSKYPELKFYKKSRDDNILTSSDNEYPRIKDFCQQYDIINIKDRDNYQKAKEYYERIESELRGYKEHDIFELKEYEEYFKLKIGKESKQYYHYTKIIFPKDESDPFIAWKSYNDILIGNKFSTELIEYYPKRGEPYFDMTDITKEQYNLILKFKDIKVDFDSSSSFKIISIKYKLIKIASEYYYLYKDKIYTYSSYSHETEPKIVKRILLIKTDKNPNKDILDRKEQKILDKYTKEHKKYKKYKENKVDSSDEE